MPLEFLFPTCFRLPTRLWKEPDCWFLSNPELLPFCEAEEGGVVIHQSANCFNAIVTIGGSNLEGLLAFFMCCLSACSQIAIHFQEKPDHP